MKCTDNEYKIFENICTLFEPGALQLVRKSDSYVSAVMESSSDYGLMDVARIKFTDRAKWIKIGPGFEKIVLNSPDDILKYTEQLREAYRFNEPYL